VAEIHHDDDNTQTHIPLAKDTMVGHYRIVEKIGAGGMGDVYLAEDTRLDRKVALKFLSPYLCQDEQCRARFTREAQAAARLDHPNIVTVHEVSEYRGRPYFAMAHVEGRPLKEYAAGIEPSIDRIVEIGIQACEGLQEAHDKGITHRDIKPSNILVDSHGRARIVDFGLASVAGKDQLTKTGSTLGTIGYMSPEQVQGKQVDHRSDLFSLGVVLYELITRQNPFKRDSEAATLKAVSDYTPEPLARFKRDVPDLLESLIGKLLEKNPGHRYQSAADLLADFKRIWDEISHPSVESAVLTQVAGKRKFPLLITALVLIAISAVVIVYLVMDRQPIRHTVAQRRQLTFFGDANLPAISPDGEYLAYIRRGASKKTRIVMVQYLGGGSPIKVYEDEAIFYLRWSPDGSELLLTAWNDSVSGIVVVPRMGGSSRQYSITGWYPTWSPDGSRIATVAVNGRIYFIDKKSGDTSSVACDTSLWAVEWSPNGDLLALNLGNFSEPYLAIGDLQGNVFGWVVDTIPATNPIWSQRGDAIYFMDMKDDEPPNVYKIRVDPRSGKKEGEPTLLVADLLGAQYSYSISGDGRKLVFRQSIRSSNLWLVQLEGQGVDQSKVVQLTTGTANKFEASISPDGSQIAFAMVTQGVPHIFTIPIEGGPPKQITHTNISNHSPVWSPDGKTIAYTTNTGDSQKIARIESGGGVPRLSEKSYTTQVLSWYPGERILYNDWRNCGFFDPENEIIEKLMDNDINGYLRRFYYSPNGQKVALIITEFEGEWHARGHTTKRLAIYSVDDQAELWTEPFDGESELIGWSQDGKWLYFYSTNDIKTTINRKRIDDGLTKSVVSLPWTDVYEIAMAPSCSTFVCVRGRSQSDIWMVENFDPDIE
jgi:Tol biopolymer transport system component/predicted Ser/Thr protein kinase